MRSYTTLLAVASFAAVAVALNDTPKAGTREHYEKLHAENIEKLKSDEAYAHQVKEQLGSFPFDFTSTFCAEASPSEVQVLARYMPVEQI